LDPGSFAPWRPFAYLGWSSLKLCVKVECLLACEVIGLSDYGSAAGWGFVRDRSSARAPLRVCRISTEGQRGGPFLMFKTCDKTSYRNKHGGSRGSWKGKRGAALVEMEGECTGGWVWQLCQSHGNKT